VSSEAPTKPAAKQWKPLAAGTEARKKKLGLCARYGCLKPAGKKKKYCPCHHHQALKRRDPISYIYSHRKQRAKARGHEWTLTLENFRDWCEWTGYHHNTGRTSESASIDRRLNQYGYHVWNLACVPLGANAAKYTHGYGGEYHLGADARYHYEPASAADAAYYAAAEASNASAYGFGAGEPVPF
jgi:hypothetical protein